MAQQPLNPVFAEENPYMQSMETVEDNQKALRRVDMGAKALRFDEPLESIEEPSLINTTEQLDEQEVEMMEEDRSAVFRGVVNQLAEGGREDILPKSIAQLQDNYKASAERAQQALTPFIARIYNTPGAENLTDQVITDIAMSDYVHNAYAVALDKQGGVEFAGDLLNMAIIPDQAYNASELTGVNWFTSYEGMEALAEQRHKLLPAERMEFDKVMMSNIKGVDDSLIQQYMTMIDVMGENPQMAAEHFSEKVFLGMDLYGVGKGILKGMRGLNKMRQLSKVGDDYTAALASSSVATDAEAAKLVGIPQVDAAMSGNPLKSNLDDVLTGATVTPSTTTRSRMQDVEEALEKVEYTIGPKILPTEAEKSEMAAKWKNIMEAQDNVESVNIEKTVDGVSIDYTTPEGEFNKYVSYKMDDFGGFEEKEMPLKKMFTRLVWSPSLLHGKDVASLVNATTFGSFQKAKAVANYDKAFKVALKGVRKNKKSLEKVNDLLGKLNGKDIEVDFHTLTNVGIGGTKLTEKEADSFMGIRRIFDHMHDVNNNTLRNEMKLRNLKHVNVGGESNYARNYDTAEDAFKAYNMDIDNNQVLRVDSDGMSSLTSITRENLDELYGKGYTLVRNESSDQYGWFKDMEGNHSRYAVVERGQVSKLPEQVLPYTPNYVPRLRDEANFFIKQKVKMKVNGNSRVRERAVAWANTEAQANKWLAKLAKTDKDFNPEDWVVHFDRETGEAANETNIRMNGGLYRGSRSSSKLLYAGDNTEGAVVDALDTLQGAIRYTSDRMAMSEVRLTLRHRWFEDAVAVEPDIRKLSWAEARGAIAESAASPQVKSKLLAVHDQISNISGIPSKSEQAFSGALRAVGKHFDKKGKESVARWMYNRASQSSPINTLKGGAFHAMLGAFNPAQYLVQAMGAAVAVGANPVSFTKAIPRLMAASMTDLADDSIMHGKALEKLRKSGLITKDMEQDILFWRDSGMFESILRNNADFDNAGKFLPTDAGAIRRGFNSLANKSTVFYEAGELGSMRTSFFTALEQLKSQAGKKWTYSDENLQRVVARAEQYRLGMSSANKAEFQKGLMALPTQFKSIYTKYLEAMFGKQFTPAEKARITLSQVALFGAAGVPIFNHYQDNVVEMLAGEDASPEEIQMYKKGAAGWLISSYFDMDAEVAGRVAIAGDIIQEVQDMLFSEEPFIKSFMGASFTTTDKAVDAIKNTLMAGKMVWDEEQMGNAAKVGLMAKYVGLQIAQIPTSTRRLLEAYMLGSMKEVRSSDGRVLYKAMEEDAQMRDVVMRAMGFSSESLQDIYETNQASYDRRDKVNDIATVYVGLMNTMTMGVDESDEQATEAVQMALSMLNSSIKNDKDRLDIYKRVDALLKEKDLKGRSFESWLELNTSELFSAKGKIFGVGAKELEEE